MTMHRLCAAALLAVGGLALVGCNDDDDVAATSTTSTGSPATTTSVTATPIDIDAPLVQEFETRVFRPALSMRVPADWTVVERDNAALQTYLGEEEYELTFDHTYAQPESVDEAIARLNSARGLTVTSSFERTVGGRAGKGFEATSEGAVRFADSGFHTNAAGTIEVIAVPGPEDELATVIRLVHGRLGLDEGGVL